MYLEPADAMDAPRWQNARDDAGRGVAYAGCARTNSSVRLGVARFRNDSVTGVGGKQILPEDPSGNPIELFQPLVPEARLGEASR